MTRKAGYWIALLFVPALAKWLVPDKLSSLPRYAIALWMASIVVAFLLATQALAQELKNSDSLRDSALHRAVLPPELRSQVYDLKTVANQLRLRALAGSGRKELKALSDSLRRSSSALFEHQQLSVRCSLFIASCTLLSVAKNSSSASPDEIIDYRGRMQESFSSLIKAANDVLVEHPE